MKHPIARLAGGLAVSAALAVHAGPAAAADDFSPAEQALFMHDQMTRVNPPVTLAYRYHRAGTLGESFDDKVSVTLRRQADGSCCIGQTAFLSGANRIELADLEGGKANPVILHFLERDIREMQRMTRGMANHFRQRIRMAIYGSAQVRPVRLKYQGAEVAGTEITITPYLDDPNRPKFENLAGKRYQFLLSDAVPGGVYRLRSQADGASPAAPPLAVEDLRLEGADAEPLPAPL